MSAGNVLPSPSPAADLLPLPIRLHPGDDLRGALEEATRAQGWGAAFVLAGIGSLSGAKIRLAGADTPVVYAGVFEVLTLSGTLSRAGAHLHISVADAQGRVVGGHVCAGCVVRTTAEVLIARLSLWHFARVHDAATGYPELNITRQA